MSHHVASGQSFLLAVAVLVPLTGCSSLLPSRAPAPDLYQLSPVTLDVRDGKPLSAQLMIEQPQAARGLDTDRIVVRSDPNEIKYLADVRWTDHVTGLIQTALIQGFESAGAFSGVGRPENALKTTYALQSDLQAFGVVADDGGPRAEIKLSAKFVRSPGGDVLATRLFTSEVAAAGRSNTAIVTAFDSAMKAIAADITAWGAESAKAHPPARLVPLAELPENLQSPENPQSRGPSVTPMPAVAREAGAAPPVVSAERP